MNRLISILAMAVVILWCGSAMAYDPIPEGWGGCNFVGEGDNVTCLGFLTEAEINGPDFQAALNDARPDRFLWSPVGDASIHVEDYRIDNFQVDNRRFADGRDPDSRTKFAALKNITSIPQIRATQIDQPGNDCTPDNDWHFQLCDGTPTSPLGQPYTGPFPVIVYHIDWIFEQGCQQECDAVGWSFEPGDGSPCDVCNRDGGDGFPNAYEGTIYRAGSSENIPLEDLTVTWVETGETVGAFDRELETYWYKGWDTGNNYLSAGNDNPVTEPIATTFIKPFTAQAPGGVQHYTVNIAGGPSFPFAQEIFSDRVMPVVSATSKGLTFQKVKANGKVKNKQRDITVVNISARELVNDAGETVLVVQWTAPDTALALSPYERSVRLRIYVGNGWFVEEGGTYDVEFAWIDAPLHASSVVVPAEVYEWIKTTTLARGMNELHISGMYREQFSGYHNRGYFEGVTFDITP